MKQKNGSGEKAAVDRDRDFKWHLRFKGKNIEDIRRGFLSNLEYNIAKDRFSLTPYDQFLSLSLTVRERLIERWIASRQQYHTHNVKRVYYLSMEFLLGGFLADNIINLQLSGACRDAVDDLQLDFEEIIDQEHDAGLGNGGLGRLAACYLDSMATLKLPALGYGIRYDFGIFNQRIVNGYQIEVPETWLAVRQPLGNRTPRVQTTRSDFTARSIECSGRTARPTSRWVDTARSHARDALRLCRSPATGRTHVNTLRLWSARAAEEFQLPGFQQRRLLSAPSRRSSRAKTFPRSSTRTTIRLGQGAAPQAAVFLRLRLAPGHHPALPAGQHHDSRRSPTRSRSSSTTPIPPSRSPS